MNVVFIDNDIGWHKTITDYFAIWGHAVVCFSAITDEAVSAAQLADLIIVDGKISVRGDGHSLAYSFYVQRLNVVVLSSTRIHFEIPWVDKGHFMQQRHRLINLLSKEK